MSRFWHFLMATTLMAAAASENFAQDDRPQSTYLFEHFDTNDGLPSNFANSVVQDSLGFLWFLHDNALTRYDGYNFKTYWHDSTDHMRLIGNTRDGMLVLDHSKNVWVVSQQIKESNIKLTLSRYDRKKDLFVQYFPDNQKARITHVCFDKNHPLVWMGTAGQGLMSFNTITGQTTQYLNGSNDANESNSFIFLLDCDSTLLLASRKGLWTFQKDAHDFRRPLTTAKDSLLLYQSPMVFILPAKDEPDHLWIVIVDDWHKLIKVDKKFSVTHLETHAPLDGEVIVSDSDGALWFTTHTQGLFCYDPRDSTMTQIKSNPRDSDGLRSHFLRGLAVDKNENLWITSYDRGITKLRRPNPVFYNYEFNGEITARTTYSLNGHDYLVLVIRNPEKGESKIAIASIENEHLNNIRFQTFSLRTPSAFPIGRINRIEKGRYKLWLGSSTGDLFSLPIAGSGTVRAGPLDHHPITGENNPLSGETITGMVEDSPNNLWISTYGNGLCNLNLSLPDGGMIVHYNNNSSEARSPGSDLIWSLQPRDSNSFYIVTAAGVDLYDKTGFHRYFHHANTMAVRTDAKGALLIGTSQGLYESTNPSSDGFQKKHSLTLARYGIFALEEDSKERLWITNDHGLLCHERNANYTMIFTKTDGVKYSRDWMGKTTGGVIITSDSRGVTVFNPASLTTNLKSAPVVFTDITVDNLVPGIGQRRTADNAFNIAKDVTLLQELRLNHRNNDFSITFSAMDMSSPKNNLYRHKLEGHDHSWVETDVNRTATYTNLDAGKYTLRVKASNHHGIWNDNERTLTVIVARAPWKTWWAYSIYGLLLLAIILYWRKYEIKRIKLKQRATYLSELDQVKTRFFTNISHEFRTPLTLILGPLREMHEGRFNGDAKPVLATMLRNGQRLLRLINQLLDLSKIEAGKLKLHAAPVEIVELIRHVSSSYESLATDKKIKYLFLPEVNKLLVHVDEEKIEKILHNLLSNAFKFTEAGGQVIVHLKPEKSNCAITVSDTGVGIPNDQLDKVFDRFYQVDSSQTRAYEGSGLGLALTKELVELHKGTISVQSTEGKGTTFSLLLPLGTEHLKNNNVSDPFYRKEPESLSAQLLAVENLDNDLKITPSFDRPVILLVEDNPDMRRYIGKTLSSQYQIIEAGNGKSGLEMAQETVPDLIISDIMMPQMDGYKLCELIKSIELTSHIPVILLTARADHQSKIAGLETGADDYLSKPFDTDELKLIVRNRIEDRRRMRERFSREITLEPKQIAITSLDEKFLTKVMGYIEEHIAEENLSIEHLSREAGYSHMQFIRKIKALTGQTPSSFLRAIRLKRAAALLAAKADNVSQIAFMVGFNSLPYFNKCFKEQFGVTPGKYAEWKKAFSKP